MECPAQRRFGIRVAVQADFVLLLIGYEADVSLLKLAGVELLGDCQAPRYDPQTMETNVPGIYIAGTAVAGTPPRKVTVIVETCHVHIPRIVSALQGQRVCLADGSIDE